MWWAGAPAALASAVARLEHLAALVLVEPAPDAVRLAEVHGVVEALALHRALAADGLGPRLAHVAILSTLGVGRRKEEGRLRSPACRTRPPRVECVDDHGQPSPFRASRGAETTRKNPDLTRGQIRIVAVSRATSTDGCGPARGSPGLRPPAARPPG